MRRNISAGEWFWVLAVSILILAIFSAPYLIALRSSTSDMAFGGFLFALDDLHTYVAKMRYGAYDGWALQLVHTSEPHRGGFVYPFYLGLGKLAAWATGEGEKVSIDVLLVAYHAARVICGLIYLYVLYRFAAEYFELPAQRRLAWTLASVVGGLGWIPLIASAARGVEGTRLPVEFFVPEASSLLLLYGLPHLLLARSLLLGGWLMLFEAVEASSDRRAVVAGVAWMGMALIVPFHVGLLGILIGGWLIGLWIVRRQTPLPELRLCAIAGMLPLMVLFYNTWLFTTDPVFRIWGRQNRLVSPPLVDYLLAYGLLVAVALPGAVRFLRSDRSRRVVLLVVWPLVAAALVYSPIIVQRRLLEGVIVPLSILAAEGIWVVVGQRSEARGADWAWRLRQIGAGSITMLLFPSAVLLLAGGVQTALRAEWPVFHPAGERASLDWLRVHAAPGSVVLSTYESGNIIPAYAGVRVYVGHGPETVNSGSKRAEAQSFFNNEDLSEEHRRMLIDEAGVDYVWVGPPEQSGRCAPEPCFDPGTLHLRPVFEQGDYTVYEVLP